MRIRIATSRLCGFATTAVLTACSATSDAPEPEPTNTVPTCSEVWVEGEKLPTDYEGCMDGEALVVPVATADGTVHDEDRLMAQPGTVLRKVGGQP